MYPIQSYHHCIARLMCNPPTEERYLNECTECPSSNNLKEHLRSVFESKGVEIV